MAKLYFYYSAMNAGKTTKLLQNNFNYIERGMKTVLYTFAGDNRYGIAKITSRIGLSEKANIFDSNTKLFEEINNLLSNNNEKMNNSKKNFDEVYNEENESKNAKIYSNSKKTEGISNYVNDEFCNINDKINSNNNKIACILIDEAQFLKKNQVKDLCRIVDELNIPVLTYGLRTDFLGEPFEGSLYLLLWSDELVEVKTICHCGKKATMNAKLDSNGNMITINNNDQKNSVKQIDIGGNDKYVSLCRKHYFMKKLK